MLSKIDETNYPCESEKLKMIFCEAMGGVAGSIDFEGVAWAAFNAGLRASNRVCSEPKGWKIVPDADNMTDDQAEAIARIANCCGGIAYSIYREALDASPNYAAS